MTVLRHLSVPIHPLRDLRALLEIRAGFTARRSAAPRRDLPSGRTAGRPLASKIFTVSEFDRRLGVAARIADEARLVTVHNGMPDVAPSLRADPGRTPVRMVMVGGRLLADAQVSPLVSNWEGFPLSILEGMRAPLPVVASSVGGIGESVRDNWEGFPPQRSRVDAGGAAGRDVRA